MRRLVELYKMCDRDCIEPSKVGHALIFTVLSTLTVFLVASHANIFREMMLLAQRQGMTEGEYVFIFFSNLPGEISLLGDYSWKRGDDLDQV